MNCDNEYDVELMEKRGTNVHHESLRPLRLLLFARDEFDVSNRLTSGWEPFRGFDRFADKGIEWTKKT